MSSAHRASMDMMRSSLAPRPCSALLPTPELTTAHDIKPWVLSMLDVAGLDFITRSNLLWSSRYGTLKMIKVTFSSGTPFTRVL